MSRFRSQSEEQNGVAGAHSEQVPHGWTCNVLFKRFARLFIRTRGFIRSPSLILEDSRSTDYKTISATRFLCVFNLIAPTQVRRLYQIILHRYYQTGND